jgi:selenium metabolism protein YedF
MKTVDAKGQLCPTPLIMTKKALGAMALSETLEVIIDNETSVKNVTRFLEDNSFAVKAEIKDGIHHLFVNKTGEMPESAPVDDYCEVPGSKQGNYVFAIQRNRLGDGDEELGKILIKALINTIVELDQLPKSILFLNSGIFLALNDSPVLTALQNLEQQGTEILVCGTCLDFYHKKEQLGVGKISNMYDILDRKSKASKVIYP